MSIAPHKDPGIVSRGTMALEEMRDLCLSLVSATLLTDDGFEVVRLPPHFGTAAGDGRLASMASSIQALSEGVARELGIGGSQYVIIAAPAGYVIQLRIPDHPLVLAALFDDEETLGKALSISRLTAEKMSTLLTSQVPESVP